MVATSESTWDIGSPLPVPAALPLGAGESLDGWTGELEPAGCIIAACLAESAAWPEECSGAAVGGLGMPRAGLGSRSGVVVAMPPISGPCMGFGGLLGVTCQFSFEQLRMHCVLGQARRKDLCLQALLS